MNFLIASVIAVVSQVYVNEPVVNMRETPTNDSVIVSQALFAEPVVIKKEDGSWLCIETPDGYQGWAPQTFVVKRSESYEGSIRTSRLCAHLYGIKDTERGPILSLPYGSPLQVLDDIDARWIKVSLPDGHEGFIQKGDVEPELKLTTKGELVLFSQKFLGLPYTWGGRSSFGYDCSGFVQMLYGQIGIKLPRDSKQQIVDNRFRAIPIESLEPGDLLFFGKAEQKIGHVGMYIGEGLFIHSTVRENRPWIRISKLSELEWSGKEGANSPYRAARQLLKK